VLGAEGDEFRNWIAVFALGGDRPIVPGQRFVGELEESVVDRREEQHRTALWSGNTVEESEHFGYSGDSSADRSVSWSRAPDLVGESREGRAQWIGALRHVGTVLGEEWIAWLRGKIR
jgi:hypothetical protein